MFGKKDIKKNNKDTEAINKNKINANETSLNETGRDLFAKLEEALYRVSKLEQDLSEKDSKIRNLQNWRTCKVCMEEKVRLNLFDFLGIFLIFDYLELFLILIFFLTKVDQVFIPCGHVICCKICITRLQTCPLCRKPIDDTILAYFS